MVHRFAVVRRSSRTVPRAVAVMLLAAGAAAPAASAAGPALEVRAPEVVRVGDVIRLGLSTAGPAPRAFQASVAFDHRLAERNGFRFRARRTGVEPLGPVRRGGTESFGAYALRGVPAGLGTLELVATRPGRLRLAVSGVRTVAADGRTSAARGRVLVVRIAGRSARVPRILQRVGVRLRPVAATAGAAGARRLDATGDAVLDRADAAELALAWSRAREPGGTPCPARDVTGDGCLDVTDVQRVADRAGGRRSAKPRRGRAANAAPIVVTSTGDGADTAPDGVCQAADGTCTLRAAITEANRQAGPNTIAFDIPGGGVRTIQLISALPTLSDTSGPTTIDGYTQPGAAPNTDAARSNAVLTVQVAGTGYSSNVDAFSITSAGNVVRGVAVHTMRRAFVLTGSGAQGNALVGNFIGTDAGGTAGATAHNLYATGVILERGAAANRIGGPAPADRNVISGNPRHGVATYGIGTNRNVIAGNLIGLSPAGDRRLQNVKHGIDVNEGSAHTVIGGTAPGEGNVISGNGFENLDDFTAGVEVSHMAETTGTRILGNRFGTDATGTSAPPHAFNSHYGIRLEDQVNDVTVADNVIVQSRRGAIKADAPGTRDIRISGNRIGVLPDGSPAGNGNFGVLIAWRTVRVTVGPGNVIAHNPVGVLVGHADSDFNTVTRNAMYANTGLGIDLEPWDKVSYNDPGDADTGTNQGLNYPHITRATTTSASGTACAGCTVEVFRADGGAGAFGEGAAFLGAAAADADGRFTVALTGVAPGEFLTSTATDAQGNTSEFSENFAVADVTAPVSSISCNGGACGSGFHAGAVEVALSATDAGGSGVGVIRYTSDGTEPTSQSPAYSAPFTVAQDTTVKFRAYDKAGNFETPANAQLIRIDPDAPASAITCDGGPCGSAWATTPVRVALSATDTGGSGVDAIRFTTDGTDPTKDSRAYAEPFSVGATTTVKFRAYDAAGNAEPVQAQVLRVDTAAPVSSITCNGGPCSTVPYTATVQVALAATDTGSSGVDAIRYTTDGTEPTKASPAYAGPLNVAETRTVRFRAYDVAGNAEPAQAQTITVQAPTYVVRDEFERSVASGLGTADSGEAWTVNSATRTSVGGGEAVLSNWTGPNQDTHAATATVRTDMEVLALVRLNPADPVGASYQARVVARAQADARNGYAARLSHTPSGQLAWGLSRIANAGGTGSAAHGSGTLMASSAAGTSWWIRLRVQGTSVRARFWQEGTPEPGTWRAAVTDSYWASGRASLGALVNAGMSSPFPSVGFRSFAALDLAAGS